MDQVEQQQQENYNYSTRSLINQEQANVLAIRLNPEETLEKIELGLRGIQYKESYDSKGNLKIKEIKVGEPLANDEGINEIMYFLRSIFDNQVVQGNLEGGDQYTEIVKNTHLDLNDKCFFFSEDLGINLRSHHTILTTIPRKAELYLTRLLKNKERESYGNIEYRESRIESPPKNNMFGLKSS